MKLPLEESPAETRFRFLGGSDRLDDYRIALLEIPGENGRKVSVAYSRGNSDTTGLLVAQDPDALLFLPVRPGRGLHPTGRRPAFPPVGHLVRSQLEPERGIRDFERTRSRGGNDRDAEG